MPKPMRKIYNAIMAAANNRAYDMAQRVYVLIAVSGILYVIFMAILYFSQNLLYNAIFVVITGVAIGLGLLLSFKSKKFSRGAVFTSVWMTLVFLPGIYFLGGGIKSSVPVWFIIGCVICALLLKGKLAGFFVGLNIAMFLICFLIDNFFPNIVMERTPFMQFLDSLIAVIGVGWMAAIMVYYQEIVCRREKALSEIQKDELYSLNRSQQGFFSNMSRRIRTPITTITGLNEITLKNENISETVAKNTSNIYSACRMLLSLVDDILDLNKLQMGNLEMTNEKYETVYLFADIYNMLKGRAKEKGLEFKLDISPDYPAVLYGDVVRIKQVLVNIVTNGIKYTREGSVTLRARGEAKNGQFFSEIDVIDTGLGIKEEDLKTLFSDFRRLDLQENQNIEGTGLGLSIVKLFTQLMGGSVSVESEYRKGSDFKVIIPQKQVGLETLGDIDIASVNIIGAGTKSTFTVKEGRVLVVDDDNMNRMVAKKLLQDMGVVVEEAANGNAALDLTKEYSYDIIFMDHMMPGIDGPETLRRIRTQIDGCCREVPVVALTANAGSEIEEYYLRIGFDGYLAKPIDGKLLEAYVRDAVSEIGDRQYLNKRRKIPFMITTDSVANIPAMEAERLNIGVLNNFVKTGSGIRLEDNGEIWPREVAGFLNKGEHSLVVEPPTEEETEAFFSEMRKRADHIIHISMSSSFKIGNYHIVEKVANKYEDITIVDSKALHLGQGLLALCAAKIVQNEQNLEHILEYIEEKKSQIEYRSIIPPNSRVDQSMILKIMGFLKLYTLLVVKKGHLTGKAFIKKSESVYDDFIKKVLSEEGISDEALFVSYSGKSKKWAEQIKNRTIENKEYQSVYLAENSSTVQTQFRGDTFSLAYIRKEL